MVYVKNKAKKVYFPPPKGAEGGGGELKGQGELKCYIPTDIQTEPLTKRVLEEHSLLKTVSVSVNALNIKRKKGFFLI